MNQHDIGKSVTKGNYDVIPLPNGNNPLTGTRNGKFTCVEIEVFVLE